MPIRSSLSSCSAWGEGGTMRDLVGWYLGWYRAARAWRLHRGLIPAPKGLCGHKEAINLACNPSGAETRPVQHSEGPTSPRSTLAYCTLTGLEAHGLSINGTAYPSNLALALRIEQGPSQGMSSFIPCSLWNFNSFTLFDRVSYSVSCTCLLDRTSHWTPKT